MTKTKDKTKNQINVIYPYSTPYNGWSFDDEEVGLQGEAFVAGTEDIITSIVGPECKKFRAYISKDEIPEYTGVLRKIDGEGIGWYQLEGTGQKGWLCPACLHYFSDYPDSIYFKIENIK